MFPKLLTTFLLSLEYQARQEAVAGPGDPQACGLARGGGESEGSLAMEQPDQEGPPWAPVPQLSFPGETAPQALGAHRLRVSASSANHSPPLAPFSATCGQCLVGMCDV